MEVDEELLTFQRFMLAFDTPAFIRRARQVEAEWNHLLAICRRERDARLEMPRLRLHQLVAATGGGQPPLEWPMREGDRAALLRLHAEWQPTSRSPVRRARSPAEIRALAERLKASFQRFNAHWEEFLGGLDLEPVNRQRDAYNRYYVLEKECAVRSARTAREGFVALAPAKIDDLRSEFPSLPIPQLGTT